jgi:hypothetical protein
MIYVESFAKKNSKPISISRADIKTPKTKIEADKKPLTVQTKNCPRRYRTPIAICS